MISTQDAVGNKMKQVTVIYDKIWRCLEIISFWQIVESGMRRATKTGHSEMILCSHVLVWLVWQKCNIWANEAHWCVLPCSYASSLHRTSGLSTWKSFGTLSWKVLCQIGIKLNTISWSMLILLLTWYSWSSSNKSHSCMYMQSDCPNNGFSMVPF